MEIRVGTGGLQALLFKDSMVSGDLPDCHVHIGLIIATSFSKVTVVTIESGILLSKCCRTIRLYWVDVRGGSIASAEWRHREVMAPGGKDTQESRFT